MLEYYYNENGYSFEINYGGNGNYYQLPYCDYYSGEGKSLNENKIVSISFFCFFREKRSV